MDMFDETELLNYETYADYLDSMVQPQDLFYLRDPHFARMVVELGYRSSKDVLTRKQFQAKKNELQDAVSTDRRPHILFSANSRTKDVFLLELAARERPNRLGMITTIISLRYRQRNGTEISGFIDYEESLRKTILDFEEGATDWVEIFKENKRIRLKKSDLGYYNWRSGYSILNDSQNFTAITDPIRGLIFESRNDRQQIFIDSSGDVGSGSTRSVVKSEYYDHVVLFDHSVRNKI